jgi:uncharacterized NAD(P)/FAD-binding protein YdhS
MKDITIIGAGLSGTLLAMNLLRQDSRQPVHIRLIDRGSEKDLGPAYSTDEDYLLNVRAEIMGALSRDPEHFLNWTINHKIAAERGDYLPRKLYREYIQSMFQEALNAKGFNKSFERIRGEAADISIYTGRPVVYLEDGSEFITDKVVLALGNSQPLNPEVRNKSYIYDKRYIRNPWDPSVLKDLSSGDSILFIGTGQTTVDLAAGLFRKQHRGKMISISRRGLFPLVQKSYEPYPSFYDELLGHSDISSVLRIVRKHIRIAEENGSDPRSVIDSLRPHTKAIWMQLLPEEKKRFFRHVFRYWEIIRSRIPPASDETINKMKLSGQLIVLSGRITDIVPSDNKIEVVYTERGTGEEKAVEANLVINCIGPCQDYEQIESKFIKNLISRKLIHSDPAHLGINALPDGSILNADGKPSDTFYTLGSPLKGVLWESIAAPEITVQAEELAKVLLE